MANFEQTRKKLAAHRRALKAERHQVLLAREAVRQKERALSEFERKATQASESKRKQLRKALTDAQKVAEARQSKLDTLLAERAAKLEAFSEFSDPRNHLQQFSDRNPILLFPLRLETRFKTTAPGKPELWVRVYPDSSLIDSFEPSLTEQEVASARAFWIAVWRARGDESLERAAWRELVAAHGSGRAGWIVREQAPMNPGDKPHKDDPTDVFLFIVAEAALPGEAAEYWRAMWRVTKEVERRQAFERLVSRLGPTRAKELATRYQPVNFADPPPSRRKRAGFTVKVVVLQLKSLARLKTRRTSWSSAPRAELLPERLVLLAYPNTGLPVTAIGNLISTPLVTGPDPNAPPNGQLKPVGDELQSKLQIPEDMTWMFDFEKALEVGMAFRVELTPEQASAGFKRLLVVGVRLADSPQEGAENLATLLEHHLRSRTGLEFIPQGTPTNNTEEGGSGFAFRDDSESTFDVFFKKTPQYSRKSDPLLRRDGEWFAEALGLPSELVQQIPGAGGKDQSEARAMQIALWPGTMGYWMKTLMAPIFSHAATADTRNFFIRYVSGRGPLPALRIGSQPYGILPATWFTRIGWFGNSPGSEFHSQLYSHLKRIDSKWKPLVDNISFIGKQGNDPHQTLLDVLGLHPTSVEYHSVKADSIAKNFFELSFIGIDVALDVVGSFSLGTPASLLRDFGAGDYLPDVLNRVYSAAPTVLSGPLIDDRPLSETERIRPYASAEDKSRNYIGWLVERAQTGIKALQLEAEFADDKKPAALLYLMLRHALQLGFHEVALRLKKRADSTDHVGLWWREPPFVHINQPKESESRYDALFNPDRAITGEPDTIPATQLVGDFIVKNVKSGDPELAELSEQIAALERLENLPTARLERTFAEHVDCVSYRLDAWKMGLLTQRIEQLRGEQQPAAQPAPGLFLGAFGWVEDLRPKNQSLSPANLSADIAKSVNDGNAATLMRDNTNGGLIHAPSVNHAATAAVLRNGYIANDGRLAINLSSRRVRLALSILEGIRNGQSMGALLGYQFERHLHDHGPPVVHAAIYPLRRAFPLAANQIASVPPEDPEAAEAIAELNVVDGRKLIEHVERKNKFTYPFELSEKLPSLGNNQKAAINNALGHIRDINDAVADLALAEGVHQAVIGNYARSAGTLEAFAKGNYPPEFEVIRTPHSGIALTLRTAIHFTHQMGIHPLQLGPLAAAEPAVNAWLADRLPPPEAVGCAVSFHNRSTGAETEIFVTQENLGLSPIDLLYRVDANPDRGLSDLEDLIVRYVETHELRRWPGGPVVAPRHDQPIQIKHTEREANKVTWFELNPLLVSLRSLLLASRPLRPGDLMRANDATRDEQAAVSLDRTRVDGRLTALEGLRDGLDDLLTDLDQADLSIDSKLEKFAERASQLAAYRLPQTGTGFVFDWRSGFYAQLTNKIKKRIEAWEVRLARYDRRIESYDALPNATAKERLSLLQAAETIVSTQLILPPLAPPQAHRSALDSKRDAFDAKLDALKEIVTVARDKITDLLVAAKALLPLTDFDHEPLDFSENDTEIDRFRDQLKSRVELLKTDLTDRIARAKSFLEVGYASATATEKVKRVQAAAKEIFGEDFQMAPQITLPAAASNELANAWNNSGNLTEFLQDPTGGARDFPIDDWLHGVARVREKMRHWENAVFLWDAFKVNVTRMGQSSPYLTPLQLPYVAGEPWLALEFPAKHKIDGDRLLYTGSFDKLEPSQPICGVMVDEWTEVIPARNASTGIAFHYDRPSCEAPQCWLLALPAFASGTWSWDELLGAVNDSLNTAKERAIEPDDIEKIGQGEFSWFLPATMSAHTFPEISIANNFLRNVDIYGRLED